LELAVRMRLLAESEREDESDVSNDRNPVPCRV
jgi:hypothetical protein